jgi:DNA-binding MarR family transcriptional regulator
MSTDERLANGISALLKLKGTCYVHVLDDLKLMELSLRQLGYLKSLNSPRGITMSELAEKLDLSKPTVTQMVRKFIKIGYAQKEACPNDGRKYYIRLTVKGRSLAEMDDLVVQEMVNKVESKLSKEDIETLTTILEKIV